MRLGWALLVSIIAVFLLAGCVETPSNRPSPTSPPVSGLVVRSNEVYHDDLDAHNRSYGQIDTVTYCEERTVCYVFWSGKGSGLSCVTDITGPLVVKKYCGQLQAGV